MKFSEPRFLEKTEYARTKPLFIRCFGDDPEFMQEYYGEPNASGRCSGVIDEGLVAAIECEGEIAAMVQVRFYRAGVAQEVFAVPYIMGVATDPDYRHRGLMDRLMHCTEERLQKEGYPWCFLIAVDREIYRHLGYIYDWELSEEECELLYADDGLNIASAKVLNKEVSHGTETLKIFL